MKLSNTILINMYNHNDQSIHIHTTHIDGINGPHIIYKYYFTFFNYLNHSNTFFKYPYYSSKTLNWVPSNHTIHLQFIV